MHPGKAYFVVIKVGVTHTLKVKVPRGLFREFSKNNELTKCFCS